MTLEPLFKAPAVVQIHAVVAIAAFVLGLIQIVAPKGTLQHRTLGWIWVLLLLTISISSFWIRGDSYRLWLDWSPIHLLSILTPVMLVVGVIAARRHRIVSHKITMVSIFIGALVIAGLFTLVPGRIMHSVLFG